MKKRHMIRTVAILLVLSLCLSILPSSVLAVPVGNHSDSDSLTLEDFYAGNATAEDLYGKLDEAIVPEIIGYETAVAKNHIGRLYEDEGTDLNKVVFLNVDGSKTMYLFDFPVKYMNETGSIQDIRLEIADGNTESGKFQTAANDAVTRFPAKFTDGISLEGNDTEIRLVPVLTTANSGAATMGTSSMTANAVADATAQRIDKNTIEYRYDNKTTVEYSLTYTGFKEDIVVSEYTGQTTYPFRLYTNGLALEEMDGSYYLVDDDGNIKATIGNIIIFTADERNNAFGDIVPTTIVENEEYLLNIVVDADYLADPDTIYPIRIDPTIEINYDNNGSSAIEDITISTNKNFSGSHDSLYVGRRSAEGIARALMRFPGLNLSNLAGATVTSATVQLRDLMCESDELAISCHVFTGNVWDANSATWSNVSPNSYVSAAMSTNTMSWSIGKTHSPVHWYSFDISSAVQGWINGTYTQNKGIIFKVASSVENGSTIANRTFGSYNRASYKPSLSITYYDGVTSVALSSTSLTMAAGSTHTLTATIYPSTAGNKNVSWSTSNSALVRVSSTGVVTAVSTGEATITCTALDSGAKATCLVTVTPTSYTSMRETDAYTSTLSAGRHVWYSFTPTETGYYMFRSTSSASTDVKAYLYLGNSQIDNNDDGAAEYRQFEIRYRLTAGNTYRLKVQGFSTSTTGSYTVSVSKCWPKVDEPDINSRSDWGADSVISDRLVPRTREPVRIIYHHSAEKFSSTDLSECKNEIKRIQDLHMNQQGKCDIAYHFIIDPAGRIWQGAAIDDYQRGHATGHYDDIGVLVLGDFESRLQNLWSPNTLNDNQKNAMITIGKWLCYKYDILITGLNCPITTHRQVAPSTNPTECPGANMAPWVENELLNLICNWRK